MVFLFFLLFQFVEPSKSFVALYQFVFGNPSIRRNIANLLNFTLGHGDCGAEGHRGGFHNYMQSISIGRIFGLLSFVFAAAMILAVSTDASGQRRGRDRDYDDRYNRSGRVYDRDNDDRYNGRDPRGNQSVRFAYSRGYQEGRKDGRQAARNNRRGGYNNDGYYGSGSRNGWGRGGEWQRAYREGYRRGFDEAYNRNRRDNRNRNSRYGNRTIFGIPY